jgi:hypothetical protein
MGGSERTYSIKSVERNTLMVVMDEEPPGDGTKYEFSLSADGNNLTMRTYWQDAADPIPTDLGFAPFRNAQSGRLNWNTYSLVYVDN